MSKITAFNTGDIITRYKLTFNRCTSFIGTKCRFDGIHNGWVQIYSFAAKCIYDLPIEYYSKGWVYYQESANENTQQNYTEKDLVSFGNYLLSAERDKLTDFFKNEVTHADLENWKESK